MRLLWIIAVCLGGCSSHQNDDRNSCIIWDTNSCWIICTDMPSINLSISIDNIWQQTPHCGEIGLNLTLRDIRFPDDRLDLLWDNHEISVVDLTIDHTIQTYIDIQPKSFDSAAFRELRHLRLSNIRTDRLRAGTFCDLRELRYLHLDNCDIAAYDMQVLDHVRHNLRALTLRSSAARLGPFRLDRLLSYTTFYSLNQLTVRENLVDTLDVQTFSGVHRLNTLDLAHCNITRLVAGTFDRMHETLTHLNLSGNRLTTLPMALIGQFITLYTIDLGDNPWHCDCRLQLLQQHLNGPRNRSFRGTLTCATPAPCLAGTPMRTATMCQSDGHTDSSCDSNQSNNNELIVPQSRYTTYDCVDEWNGQCEQIQLRDQSLIKKLSLVAGGQLLIDVVDGVSSVDLVAIWFQTIRTTTSDKEELYESSEEVTCRSSYSAQIRVGPLMPDTGYTVCLVNRSKTTVSPLDCAPYYNRTRFDEGLADDAWILEEDKARVISMVVFGASMSLLFGVVMSFVLLRMHPAWLRGNQRVVRMKSDASANSGGVMVMPPGWQSRNGSSASAMGKSSHRCSTVSTICDGNRTQPQQCPSACNENNENKYYLDFMPHKEPPPLPPPNVPVLYGLARSQAAADNGDNYYSQVGPKTRHH